MILEKFLNNLIVLEVIRGDSEYLESLLLSNETTLDAQALFSDLFAAFIAEFFHLRFHTFLLEVALYLLHTLRKGKRTNPAAL